jgi:hypothetical protein
MEKTGWYAATQNRFQNDDHFIVERLWHTSIGATCHHHTNPGHRDSRSSDDYAISSAHRQRNSDSNGQQHTDSRSASE